MRVLGIDPGCGHVEWHAWLHVPSVANRREHWAAKARRAREHRATAKAMTADAMNRQSVSGKRIVVTITRMGRTLDSDNLASACKAIRDGIADALGIDDGDARIEWRYAQGKAPAKPEALKYRRPAPSLISVAIDWGAAMIAQQGHIENGGK